MLTSAIALMLAVASPDSSELLQDGVRAWEVMEIERAESLLSQARRAASSKDRPRVELWLGIVELEQGREASGRRWLKSALQANPRLSVKQELSPKILADIAAVRAQVTRPPPPPPRKKRDLDQPAPVVTARLAPPAAQERSAAPAPIATAPTMIATAPIATAPSGPAGLPPAPPRPAAREPFAVAASSSDLPVISEPPSPIASGDLWSSPTLIAGATSGAVAGAALAAGAVFGVMAKVGGDAAERELNASTATRRYEDATSAAFAANTLFLASGVAAGVGVVCGSWWLVEEQ